MTISLRSLLFLLPLVATLLPVCADAQVVLKEDFETNKYTFDPNATSWRSSDDKWGTTGACQDFNLAIIDAPCGDGQANKALRMISRMGRDNRECATAPWKNPHINPHTGDKIYKNRIEVVPRGAGDVLYGKDWWMGMRIYVPADFPNQIPVGDNQPHRPGGRIVSIVQVIASQASRPGTDFKLGMSSKTGEGRWYIEKAGDLGPIERGKWADFVIHLKRSTGSDGVLEVWKNGQLAASYKGHTTTDAAAGFNGSFKYGLYGLGDDQGQPVGIEYILYFDDVKVAYGPNQLAAVQSASPPECQGPAHLPGGNGNSGNANCVPGDPGGKFAAVKQGNGTVYHVSKNCGAGKLCTVGQVEKLPLKPGDSVLFERGGVWKGKKAKLRVPASGTPDNPIYFGAYGSGPAPKFDGHGLYDGSGGITVTGKTGVVFDGLEVTGFGKGVMIRGKSSSVTLHNMHVHHAGQACINADDDVSYIVVQNSEIGHCGQTPVNGEGIYISTDAGKPSFPDFTHHILVRNNFIHDTTHEGIEVKGSATNVTIEGNRIVNAREPNGAINVSQWSKIDKGGLRYKPGVDPADPPPGFVGDHIIRNNEISGGKVGIRMKAGGEVTGNKVSGTSQEEILVYNPGNHRTPIVVTGNTARVVIHNNPNITTKTGTYSGANAAPCAGGGGMR